MEYGTAIPNIENGQIANDNYNRYVGWPEAGAGNPGLTWLFSNENLNNMSRKITQLTQGVDPEGRNIIVPNDKIAAVLSNLLVNYRPTNIGGDMYTRYQIPTGVSRCDPQFYVNAALNIITKYIGNDIGMTECNKRLSIWDSILGDFNRNGLRAHPEIKIRNRHPQYMMFNMNY